LVMLNGVCRASSRWRPAPDEPPCQSISLRGDRSIPLV
jgi:hypothetical protein